MPYNADGEYYSYDDEDEGCSHCDCYQDGGRCCDCGDGDDTDEDGDATPTPELTTDDDGSEEVKD